MAHPRCKEILEKLTAEAAKAGPARKWVRAFIYGWKLEQEVNYERYDHYVTSDPEPCDEIRHIIWLAVEMEPDEVDLDERRMLADFGLTVGHMLGDTIVEVRYFPTEVGKITNTFSSGRLIIWKR